MRFNVFFLLTQRFVPLQPRSSLTDTAVFGQVTSHKSQVTFGVQVVQVWQKARICKVYNFIIYYNIIYYNNIIKFYILIPSLLLFRL